MPKSDDDDSSASEYGDNGDAPCYADEQQSGGGPTLARKGSTASLDSLADDPGTSSRIQIFISTFLEKIFNPKMGISPEDKAQFTKYCQHHIARTHFAKEMRRRGLISPGVTETAFNNLVTYFSIVLQECNECEDFMPAKQLMSLSFTFYTTGSQDSKTASKTFLYTLLKDQIIWQSLRFWNAIFFAMVQQERAKASATQSKNVNASKSGTEDHEKAIYEKIVLEQLSTFTKDMKALSLSKDLCLDFLRRQSDIAGLKPEQIQAMKEGIEAWT